MVEAVGIISDKKKSGYWYPGPHLNIKMPFCQYGNSHYKHKTLSRQCYLYMEIHTWKDRLYIETEPRPLAPPAQQGPLMSW